MRAKFYHYLIVLTKVDIPSFLVSIVFHDSLSFQELLSNFCEYDFPASQHVINGRYIRCSHNILRNIEGLPTKGNFIR